MSPEPSILDIVTAPDSPFAITSVDGVRCFANSPASLAQLIESARRHGERILVVEGSRRLTYAEAFAHSDALASALTIVPGDRVAICMRNRIEWLIGFLAILRAGGIAVLVNSRGSPDELVNAVASVEPRLVLADGSRAELLEAGGFEGRVLRAEDYPVAGTTFTPPPSAAPDDPAAILFTSGTAGRVKGAVLTHRNIVTGITGVQMAGLMVLHSKARALGVPVERLFDKIPPQATLLVYPLFHISGLAAGFLSPLLNGAKIVILPRWDPAEAAQAIEREGITQFAAVPTMLWDMLDSAALRSADLSSLANIGIGGQALPINLLDAVREACPHAVMGTGYGLTETAGSIAMAIGEDFLRKKASAGRVLPTVELRIEGPEGVVLPPGEAGEIVVRGAQVLKEYWNSPEDTAKVLSADKWFHTEDIGYVDEEGYIFIVDRKKDMVISGGENIYCAEVERVLSELPQITECAAFGIPDARLGELLVAVVRGAALDPEQVKAHVGERLARYKAPAHVAVIDAPLPRNHLDKVDKFALRAAWPSLLKEPA